MGSGNSGTRQQGVKPSRQRRLGEKKTELAVGSKRSDKMRNEARARQNKKTGIKSKIVSFHVPRR